MGFLYLSSCLWMALIAVHFIHKQASIVSADETSTSNSPWDLSIFENLDDSEIQTLREGLVRQRGQLGLLVDHMKGLAGLLVKLKEEQGSQPPTYHVINGSTTVYTRWGRKTCDESLGTEMVYTGYAAGSHFTHTGGAANTLCLPTDPVLENDPDGYTDTLIYGAEYEATSLMEQDVPCSVCEAPRSTTLMIPAKTTCPTGWSLEYSGRLMAGYYNHNSATEFICMDTDIESLDGGHVNHNGRVFYFVKGVCGSLKCPPYDAGKILTCVVCTK